MIHEVVDRSWTHQNELRYKWLHIEAFYICACTRVRIHINVFVLYRLGMPKINDTLKAMRMSHTQILVSDTIL